MNRSVVVAVIGRIHGKVEALCINGSFEADTRPVLAEAAWQAIEIYRVIQLICIDSEYFNLLHRCTVCTSAFPLHCYVVYTGYSQIVFIVGARL